jgi:hypothetical protein
MRWALPQAGLCRSVLTPWDKDLEPGTWTHAHSAALGRKNENTGANCKWDLRDLKLELEDFRLEVARPERWPERVLLRKLPEICGGGQVTGSKTLKPASAK